MAELLHNLRRPFAVVAAALSSVALSGCLDGGNKTIDLGIRCMDGTSPRVATTDEGWWDNSIIVSCEDSQGNKQAPSSVKLPHIEDGDPQKPNFTISVRVNNRGLLWATKQATPSYDSLANTLESAKIGLDNTDSIESVKISPIKVG